MKSWLMEKRRSRRNSADYNWNTVSGTRCLCEGRTGRGGKKRIADWEKKGEFPEPLRTQSHTPKARIAALIWVIIIVMGILFNIGFSMFR